MKDTQNKYSYTYPKVILTFKDYIHSNLTMPNSMIIFNRNLNQNIWPSAN